MAVFKKRETITENLTYMAIMAAINVIFVLLTFFVPFLLFILVFVLPLGSAIVAIYCKKKYYPIYAIVTIGICMLVTMTDFADTIFFVVPSIITGFVFGFLIEKRAPSILIIASTALLQALLTYPGLWLANAVLYPGQKDIFVVIANGIGITNESVVEYVKHMGIAVISLIQEIIAFIVIKEESSKLGINVEENSKLEKLIPTVCIFGFAILSLLFAFIYPQISYSFMLGTILFGIYQIACLIQEKKKYILISLGASVLLSIFVFAGCYASIPKPLGFLCVQVLFCLVGIIGLINNYLPTHNKKI